MAKQILLLFAFLTLLLEHTQIVSGVTPNSNIQLLRQLERSIIHLAHLLLFSLQNVLNILSRNQILFLNQLD